MAIANLVMILPLLAAPAQAAAQVEPPGAPVVLQGDVPAGTTSVDVFAQPHEPNATSGPMRSWRVPVDSTIADGQYTARVRPAVMPARVVRPGGLVDFEVVAHGENGQSSTTWVSVRIARVGAAVDWMDPVATSGIVPATSKIGEVGSLTVNGGETVQIPTIAEDTARSVPSTLPDAAVTLEFPPLYGDPSARSLRTTTATGGVAASAYPCRRQGWDYTSTYRTRPATIGTGYPVGTDTSRMVISSSQGASYGLAASGQSAWGGFYANGSRFIQSGWGFTWASNGAQRSYRKGIKYQLMRAVCYGTGTLSPPRFVWRPVGETGGTSSNEGLTRPGWNRCRNVDPGVWRRERTDGNAYSYGASVKMKNVIGIDLSINRNYSSSQRLEYDLDRIRRLCGNNGEISVAGKVMARFKN